MKNPRFLNLSCPKIRGKKPLCETCPLDRKGYCWEFSDYIENHFSLLGAGIDQLDPKAPLRKFLTYIENNIDNYTTAAGVDQDKFSFDSWLGECYKKVRFLSFSCCDDQGAAKRCVTCPVGLKNCCEPFTDYLSTSFVSENHKYPEGVEGKGLDGGDVFSEHLNLFVIIENKFSYNGSGAFKAWMNGIVNNILRLKNRQKYHQIRIKTDEFLKSLEEGGYVPEVLTGQEFLSKRRVRNVTIPGQQPWEKPRFLTLLDLPRQNDVLLRLAQFEDFCLMVQCSETNLQGDIQNALDVAEQRMRQNNGILIVWYPVSGHMVVNLKQQIDAIIHQGESERSGKGSRNRSGKGLKKILAELKEGRFEIRAGESFLARKKISGVDVVKKLPGEKSEAVFLVDIHRYHMLQLLAALKNSIILIFGSGNGLPEEEKKDLYQRWLQDAHDLSKSNSGILLHLGKNLNPESFKKMSDSCFHERYDEVSIDDIEKQGGDGTAFKPFEQENECEKKQLGNKLTDCLEKALTREKTKKCALLMMLFFKCYQDIQENLEKMDNPGEYCFKNGKIKDGKVFEIMAMEQNKTKDAVKRMYARCMANGSYFIKFLRQCLT